MDRPLASKSAQSALLALAAVLAVFAWQSLTVHYNYGGNWTALFCISPQPVPAFLKSEHLYIFHTGGGYDGMIYHLIAHDPWMRKGSAAVIPEARFRYQRILVPMVAWLLAFGQDQWIHAAYLAVVLAFVFLGAYWLSRFAMRIGRSPVWGLAFLLTPATITSIDRMTVDVALAALTAGFVLYAGESPDWKVLAILACAALSRETGLILIAGYSVYLFSRKNIRGSILAAAAGAPEVAWFLFVGSHHLQKPGAKSSLSLFVARVPLSPFFLRLVHPRSYGSFVRNVAGRTFDVIGLLGAALMFAYVVQLLIQRNWDPYSAVIYLFALGAIFIGPHGIWYDSYGYGRILTPLLLLTAVVNMRSRPVAAFLPIILIDLRVGLNLVLQIRGVIHGLTGL